MRVFKFTLLSLAITICCNKIYAYDCEVDGIYYNRLSTTEFELTYGENRYSGNLVIPEKVAYKGKTFVVSTIGEKTFENVNLTSLTIPQSITHIKKEAFYYCYAVDTVHIHSLKSWINIDFDSDTSNPLTYSMITSIITNGSGKVIEEDTLGIRNPILFIDGVETTDLEIPDSIREIKKYAFRGWRRLKSVRIGDAVNTIGVGAFAQCRNLESVYIGKGVKTIDKYAFRDCDSLAQIIFSNRANDSLLYINREAFQSCISLPHIELPSKSYIDDDAFHGCSKLNTAIIDGVWRIDDSCFKDCKSLKKISVGSYINYIGEFAFNGCDSLKEVHISNISNWCKCYKDLNSNLLIKGCKLFVDGDTITNLVIDDDVKIIQNYSFINQTSITTATIGNSVEKICQYSFNGCSNLSTLYVLAQTPPEIESMKSWDGNIIWPFDDVNFTWTDLFVPTGTLESYNNSNGWKKFKSIQEFDSSSLDISNVTSDNNSVVRYSLNGNVLSTSTKGINIIRMEDGTTKKVIVK